MEKVVQSWALWKPRVLSRAIKTPVRGPNASSFHQPCRKLMPAGKIRKERLVCSTTFKEKQPVTRPEGAKEKEQEPFDWNKCWYPVAVLADLEPKRPTPVKLLGKDVVLWRDVNKEWKCFEDACPHRLAPLSEGRIEPSDGSLMCSYHGWRFQSNGECTRIPQAKDGGVSTGCKNPRSRAKAFPVKVERELVWIWPDDSPSAFIDSAVKKLEGKNYYEDDRYIVGSSYMRELPYPIDFLIENILDPAHVPFSHHGLIGSRDFVRGNEARKLDTSVQNELKFFFTGYAQINGADSSKSTTVTYNPPDVICHSEEYPGPCMQIRMTPVSTASSKIFFQYALRKEASLFVSFLRKAVFRPWFFHVFEANIDDGDMVFLNGQARKSRRLEQEGKGWKSQYYMPISCDAAIVGFRRWLNGKIGGGGPKLPNGSPLLQNSFPDKDRRQLLDRYNSHTKHCKICMGTLRNTRILKALAYVACVGFATYSVLLTHALIIGSAGASIWRCIRSTFGLLVCAVASQILSELEQQLIFANKEHWKTVNDKHPFRVLLNVIVACLFF